MSQLRKLLRQARTNGGITLTRSLKEYSPALGYQIAVKGVQHRSKTLRPDALLKVSNAAGTPYIGIWYNTIEDCWEIEGCVHVRSRNLAMRLARTHVQTHIFDWKTHTSIKTKGASDESTS